MAESLAVLSGTIEAVMMVAWRAASSVVGWVASTVAPQVDSLVAAMAESLAVLSGTIEAVMMVAWRAASSVVGWVVH